MKRTVRPLTTFAFCASIILVSPMGCRSKAPKEQQAKTGSGEQKKSHGSTVPPTHKPLPLDDFLKTVPNGAESAGLADLSFLRGQARWLLAALIGDKDAGAILSETDGICRKHLGITCTTMNRVALWTGPENKRPVATHIAVWGLRGKLAGKPGGAFPVGAELRVHQEGDRIVLSNPEADAMAAGKKGALLKAVHKLPTKITSRFKDMQLLYFLNTKVLPQGAKPTFPAGTYFVGLQSDGNLLVAAMAEPAVIAKVKTMYQVGLQLGLAGLETKLRSADKGQSLGLALAAGPGIHFLKSLAARIKMTQEDNVLIWETHFPNMSATATLLATWAMGVAAWVGTVKKGRRSATARPAQAEQANALLKQANGTVSVPINPKIVIRKPHARQHRKPARSR